MPRTFRTSNDKGPTNYRDYIRLADFLREEREFEKAARNYEAALAIDGRDPAIWVQFGNMLKDSRQLSAAERAYRTSLALDDSVADCHVQLGRALKLQGRREEALEAFSRALKLDPKSNDAALELISIGEFWRVQQKIGLGTPIQQELLATISGLKQTLQNLEQSLPSIHSLSSIVRERYDLFQHIYRVTPPPEEALKANDAVSFIIFDCDQQPGVLPPAIESALSLLTENAALAVITTHSQAINDVANIRSNGPAIRRYLIRTVAAISSELINVVNDLADAEWIILSRIPVLCSTFLYDWINWASKNTPAIAIYWDEDEAAPANSTAALRHNPTLKATLDAEELDVGNAVGSALAVRRRDLLKAVATPFDAHSWWTCLVARLRMQGQFAHIPRILATRTRPRQHLCQGSQVRSIKSQDTTHLGRIGIIIPTKNQRPLLAACIASLRSTAARPDQLDICVVDNGSDDPETLRFIASLTKSGEVRSLKVKEPFNWSRLNNLAVAHLVTDYLVFVNNDVEILSAGWDNQIRQSLSQSDVGAVGVCLIYPDRSVQHAGMVLGMANITEHEGRHHPIDQSFWESRIERTRTVGAVTGAFLACRRNHFLMVDGFDEVHLPVVFNDVDFCLKLRSLGYRIVYEPRVRGLHHESKSLDLFHKQEERARSFGIAKTLIERRWGKATLCDPGFNPHFARWGRPFEYLREPSSHEILDYALRSSSPQPWRIDPPCYDK